MTSVFSPFVYILQFVLPVPINLNGMFSYVLSRTYTTHFPFSPKFSYSQFDPQCPVIIRFPRHDGVCCTSSPRTNDAVFLSCFLFVCFFAFFVLFCFVCLFSIRLNRPLNKQLSSQWFETQWRPWEGTVMELCLLHSASNTPSSN